MKFTKSIHWRLLLWIAFLLGLVLLALDFTGYEIYLSNRVGQLDDALRQRAGAMSADVFEPETRPDFGAPPVEPAGDPPGDVPPPDNGPPDMAPPHAAARKNAPPERPPFDVKQVGTLAKRFETAGANGFYVVVWRNDSNDAAYQSTNHPVGVAPPQLQRRDTGTYTRTRNGFREAYHATEFGDCILVGRTLAPVFADARRFVGWFGLGSLVVLAFGLGGAWFIVAGALRPVNKISAAAARISSGDLSQRISLPDAESELGQLAGVLNSTFARLEAAFTQQKQFTADAAHELRTPLAVMISEAQITLARERAAPDYRDALTVCLETAQQMRRLTESLLELARFDAGQENLRREKLEVSVVVADCVKLLAPLAAGRSVKINCSLMPAQILGDAERLAQVVTNLLTNAIHYNREGGDVGVTAGVENGMAVVRVSDTGCGISSADLSRIFERFYRANRSRGGSHAGLGLAIAQSIVQAHGGKIEAASVANSGATFTVRLPLAT
ncbi:putative Histidine kinase [Verrucomicrobia bacterium]|nr:putative Histidine kinase [Verrucomicrobiota bacterium]